MENQKTVVQKALDGVRYGLPVAALVSLPAHANTDYSTLTNAFAPTEIISGILAIGAVLAAIYVSWRGVGFVLAMMKSK